MAELPFNIVTKIFGMVCPVYALSHAQKRVNSYEASEGVTDTTNTYFIL